MPKKGDVMEGNKNFALVVLGITSVITIVGMVMFISNASSTGSYVIAGEFAQFNPKELCEEKVGCPFKGVEGGTTYSSQGPLVAVCACPGGDVRAITSRLFNWRSEYYPTD